ncbi:MAG TPA: sigma-70 family RNA polymerase sigma factor [Puia sp.]|nr:sigma-70 family RNA polymerase sigma factor [Puia sp.]
MNRSEEHRLIRKFNRGAADGYRVVFDLYFRVIFLYAKRIIGNGDDAYDIASDIFLRLWEMRERFESLAKIRAFLFTACRNACLDFIHHIKIRNAKHQIILDLFLASQDRGMESAQTTSELLLLIQQEIDRLPRKCRNVMILYYLQDMTTAAVAAMMKISEKTVSNQRLRGLKILKIALKGKAWSFFCLLWPME